ncbi:MAG TPA: hypothetical protein VHJ20_16570 [Polyangia bacterium]|nr:hypothetical protein [Polyangia bacterium]
MRATFFAIPAVALMLFVGRAEAYVGDRFNLVAPGAVGYATVNDAVAVRKSDGSIWVKDLQPSASAWVSIGNPTGGTTSGPQIAEYKPIGGSYQGYVVVRGSDGNMWETHKTSTWSSWSSTTFGQPPGGSNSAPAVTADVTYGLVVVTLDNSNIPWINRLYPGGGTSGWQQAGAQALTSAPGVAITPQQTVQIFGLLSPNLPNWSECSYGGCYTTWSYLGGWGASGLSAVGNRDGTGTTRAAAVVWGTDGHVYEILEGTTWGTWSNVSGAGVVDAQPAVLWFSVTEAPIVIDHRSDGNYYASNTSIGHP